MYIYIAKYIDFNNLQASIFQNFPAWRGMLQTQVISAVLHVNNVVVYLIWFII